MLALNQTKWNFVSIVLALALIFLIEPASARGPRDSGSQGSSSSDRQTAQSDKQSANTAPAAPAVRASPPAAPSRSVESSRRSVETPRPQIVNRPAVTITPMPATPAAPSNRSIELRASQLSAVPRQQSPPCPLHQCGTHTAMQSKTMAQISTPLPE